MQPERSFFRLHYPEGDRPALRIAGADHPVADLSEEGVRFLAPAGPWTGVTGEVEGLIRLADGEELAVRGSVIRAEQGFVVLRLSRGVPLAVMIREQQRVRREHRRFGGSDLPAAGAPPDGSE